MKFNFSEKEIAVLRQNLGIAVDSREQDNKHLIEFFEKTDKHKKKKIKYKTFTLNQGDYSAYLESNEQTRPLGITRDILFSDHFVIERKNSLDELVGNFVERDRLENELARLQRLNIVCQLWVEDEEGYYKMLRGEYKSEMHRNSVEATYNTFQARYGVPVMFYAEKEMGYRMTKYLFSAAVDVLKNRGFIDFE